MESIKILSTKKLENRSREMILDANMLLVEKNFISISFKTDLTTKGLVVSTIDDREINDFVFSSSNAVKAVDQILLSEGKKLEGRTIFCLAGKTRKSIEQSFPDNHIVADALNASELANEVVSTGLTEIVFFCGNRRREELPSVLSLAGVRVLEIEVYDTTELPEKLEEKFDAALFFSPSAAESFSQQNQPGHNLVCFCIGDTTAGRLKELGAGKIIISPFPQEEKLVETLINYYKNR